MAQRLFQKRMPGTDSLNYPPARFPQAPALPKELEFTASGKNAVSCSLRVAQGLQALGCDEAEMAKGLETVRILRDSAGREINPVVFVRMCRSYRMAWGPSAAIASLCRQEAADLGLVFRSLMRFYKRSHMKESDLDEVERFVEWIILRNEPIRGVSSAWKEYKRRK